MPTLNDIRTALSARIGEFSQYVPNETLGTGDGSKTIFYVKLPPIASGSLTVYLDGSATSGSNYLVDYDYGRITFLTAPSSGSVVSADYRGLHFHVDDLDSIIREAVQDLELIYSYKSFSLSGTSISPAPTTSEARLIVQQCVVNFLESFTVRLTSDAIRTASTGFSVDTTARANIMSRLLEFQQTKLENYANRLSISLSRARNEDWIY